MMQMQMQGMQMQGMQMQGMQMQGMQVANISNIAPVGRTLDVNVDIFGSGVVALKVDENKLCSELKETLAEHISMASKDFKICWGFVEVQNGKNIGKYIDENSGKVDLKVVSNKIGGE